MKTVYRDPQVEEAPRNLIFQNRCGSRLTLLLHNEHTELEFVYKPNALRRKEFTARNFSNRDNFTTLFRSATWPDLKLDWFKTFDYDPFHTRLGLEIPSDARNKIEILNLADENAFVLTARQPLTLALRPHQAFAKRDGLLWEHFEDRGEDIWSFVAFRSFEQSRFRVLDDGTHVLQLVENDVVILGGEESRNQMEQTVTRLRGREFTELVSRNEATLATTLSRSRLTLTNPDAQRVLDINRRIAWSGMDEGGACFGAINRIYHLIWVRDGSMTACHMALSGVPEFLRIWAPFLLANPSYTRRDDGSVIPEFGQMVGSRWSKSEEDGIFYATWTAFTHFRVTGDDRLLSGPAMPLLLECIDRQLDKCWNESLGMMGSDTLGEDSLHSSPYYGYDIVNGSINHWRHSAAAEGPEVHRCHSLYHQVNTINLLSMALVLLEEQPGLAAPRANRYRALLARIRETLRTSFVTPDGQHLRSIFFTYTDGSSRWVEITGSIDFWEHCWALAQGPFSYDLVRQLKGVRFFIDAWPKKQDRSYGFCPWNVMVRFLREHGLGSPARAQLLADEVKEALMLTTKYPMPGGLTEDHRAPETWRALPFSAGSFTVAHSALVLAPLALGLGVRASSAADRLEAFSYRLSRIDAELVGAGDDLVSYELNGERFALCLQLPENRLKAGRNTLNITRGLPTGAQLWGSDAELIDAREHDGALTARFRSPLSKTFWVRNADKAARITLHDAAGAEVKHQSVTLPETNLTVLQTDALGEVVLMLKT